MTSLTHASAGALAGEFIPNPIIAFFVGIIIHLFMDKIPHYWPSNSKQQNVIKVGDTAFSALFLGALYLTPATNKPSVIAGALGGVVVDFFFVLVMREKGKMAEWHTNRQPHRTEKIWVLSDVLQFLAYIALLGVVVK